MCEDKGGLGVRLVVCLMLRMIRLVHSELAWMVVFLYNFHGGVALTTVNFL